MQRLVRDYTLLILSMSCLTLSSCSHVRIGTDPADRLAQEFVDKTFSHCGNSYFGAVPDSTDPLGPRFCQIRDLSVSARSYGLADADKLNGYEWSGEIAIHCGSTRALDKSGGWSDWRPGCSTNAFGGPLGDVFRDPTGESVIRVPLCKRAGQWYYFANAPDPGQLRPFQELLSHGRDKAQPATSYSPERIACAVIPADQATQDTPEPSRKPGLGLNGNPAGGDRGSPRPGGLGDAVTVGRDVHGEKVKFVPLDQEQVDASKNGLRRNYANEFQRAQRIMPGATMAPILMDPNQASTWGNFIGQPVNGRSAVLVQLGDGRTGLVLVGDYEIALHASGAALPMKFGRTLVVNDAGVQFLPLNQAQVDAARRDPGNPFLGPAENFQDAKAITSGTTISPILADPNLPSGEGNLVYQSIGHERTLLVKLGDGRIGLVPYDLVRMGMVK